MKRSRALRAIRCTFAFTSSEGRRCRPNGRSAAISARCQALRDRRRDDRDPTHADRSGIVREDAVARICEMELVRTARSVYSLPPCAPLWGRVGEGGGEFATLVV